MYIHDTGTFWYHSHLATQYCDGLRGPLVIYDPQDPFLHMYDIDDGQSTRRSDSNEQHVKFLTVPTESTIITLADWYHHAGLTVPFPPYVALLVYMHSCAHHLRLASSEADATLINGLGRFTGGPASPLSVISVQHGKRRVVATALSIGNN